LGTRRTAQVFDQQVVITACGQTPRAEDEDQSGRVGAAQKRN